MINQDEVDSRYKSRRQKLECTRVLDRAQGRVNWDRRYRMGLEFEQVRKIIDNNRSMYRVYHYPTITLQSVHPAPNRYSRYVLYYRNTSTAHIHIGTDANVYADMTRPDFPVTTSIISLSTCTHVFICHSSPGDKSCTIKILC